MSDFPEANVQTYEKTDFIMLRTFLRDLAGFKPRAAAHRRISVRPDATAEQVVELLRGYDLFWSSSSPHGEELAFRRDGHVVCLEKISGHIGLLVFSERFDASPLADEVLRLLAALVMENRDDGGVWADFSYLSGDRVIRTTQFLRCPSWEAVCGNYPSPARGEIERLLGMPEPWSRGRLVIWHGPPGTGKTYAIRALMMKWKDRFDFLVVTDPERLAADPGYFYRVAGRSREMPRRLWADPEEEGPGEESRDGRGPGNGKRVLFILEDTADLILQESRSAHFDKIGKLLNMTDGLFGQGREDIFLLTFNEEVERIDPAFLRPGRCIANVEFPRFRPAEAVAWLRDHGRSNGAPGGEMTLAEMYARILDGEAEVPGPQRRGRAVGFTAPREGSRR